MNQQQRLKQLLSLVSVICEMKMQKPKGGNKCKTLSDKQVFYGA